MYFDTFLFDIDGTLTDSSDAILHALQDLLFYEAQQKYTLEELYFALGLPNTKLGDYLGIKDWNILLKNTGSKYYDNYSKNICLFPGLDEVLNCLKNAGCCLGIVTSKSRKQFLTGFAKQPYAELFQYVVCDDDTNFHKPHPTPLLKCMDALGCTSSHTIFIGDSYNDMCCAKNAGITSALALWGSKEAYCAKADIYLNQPMEILKLI